MPDFFEQAVKVFGEMTEEELNKRLRDVIKTPEELETLLKAVRIMVRATATHYDLSKDVEDRIANRVIDILRTLWQLDEEPKS